MTTKPVKITAGVLVGWLLITIIPVLLLRWFEPPTSAFMLRQRFMAWHQNDHQLRLRYDWVDWSDISPHAPLAAVAAEDQKFPFHWGFDVESISQAWEEKNAGIRVRGASTISQQVAKNLFLWPGKNFVRKGLEAYFTVLVELLWPKRRILETYLNIAQFGKGVYGIGAASHQYFCKPPYRLAPYECALMAAVLPNPIRLRLQEPSPYVQQRAEWILSEMARLERIDPTPYLNEI